MTTTAATAPSPAVLMWGLTFTFALVVGLIVGALTLVQTKGNWPAALLAALGAAGATIVGVHEVLM
jgi:hypothetical protein